MGEWTELKEENKCRLVSSKNSNCWLLPWPHQTPHSKGNEAYLITFQAREIQQIGDMTFQLFHTCKQKRRAHQNKKRKNNYTQLQQKESIYLRYERRYYNRRHQVFLFHPSISFIKNNTCYILNYTFVPWTKHGFNDLIGSRMSLSDYKIINSIC